MKEIGLIVEDVIKISHLTGEIIIECHDKEIVEIESDLEEFIDFSFSENSLFIKGIPQQKEITPSKGLFSGIFNKNDSVNEEPEISEKQFISVLPEVKMKIKVPKNRLKKLVLSSSINLTIHGVSEELLIENYGELIFSVKDINLLSFSSTGSLKGKAEEMTQISIDSSGKTEVDVKSATFSLVKMDLGGETDILVKGAVEVLDVALSGQGNVVVKGKVSTKSISTSVMCDVIIKD